MNIFLLFHKKKKLSNVLNYTSNKLLQVEKKKVEPLPPVFMSNKYCFTFGIQNKLI